MYSGIKSSRNGYASITYPMTEKKKQTENRIGAFRCGGGIIDTGSAAGIRRQFARVWKRADRKIGDIQAYMLLYSFSKKELDPDRPQNMELAADLAVSAIEELYPGHQYTLVVQKDGKGGKIHAHGTVNALHRETLKACRGAQTSYAAVRAGIEDAMTEAGIAIDPGKSHRKRQKKREVAAAKDGYSWIEDLAGRIRLVLQRVIRFDELEEELSEEGVVVLRKTKSNWTFALMTAPLEQYIGKKARGSRMDEAFTPSRMRQTIDQNYRHQRRVQQAMELTENLGTDTETTYTYKKGI